MDYLNKVIGRYKNIRSMKALEKVYNHQYALVGIGNHCMSNLLPVIQHLQIPLKYICCTSEKKAALITKKYRGVEGTNSLQQILDDEAVDGVFVAASPRAHYGIAKEVIKSGKALFIEKPPCRNNDELNSLIDSTRLYGGVSLVVGLQRRFAPATRILQKRLKKEHVLHYHYCYLTGLYPEGDAMTDLFIHPIDYVLFLFGKAEIVSANMIKASDGGNTLLLTLQHKSVLGMLELSTAYSWNDARETLNINTNKGVYELDRMEQLDFTPKNGALLGLPLEKVVHRNIINLRLYGRNGFVPTIVNNQIYSQGFFSEIETFANIVEERQENMRDFGLESVRSTYELIKGIEDMIVI